MIVEGDSLAVCLWNEYGGAMSDSKHLDEEEVRKIYFYIENERRKNNYPKSEPGVCQKNLKAAMEGFAERQRIRDSIFKVNPPLLVGGSGERISTSRFYYPFLISDGWSNCDRYLSGDNGVIPIANLKITEISTSGETGVSLSQLMLISHPRVLQHFYLPDDNEGFRNRFGSTIWITKNEPMLVIALQDSDDGLVGIHIGEYLLKEFMELSVPLILVPKDEVDTYLRQNISEFTE